MFGFIVAGKAQKEHYNEIIAELQHSGQLRPHVENPILYQYKPEDYPELLGMADIDNYLNPERIINCIKITWKNCSWDYDVTIVQFSELNDYMEIFYHEFEDLDPIGYSEWFVKGYIPECHLEPCQMTLAEYNKWFVENIESRA